jgi:hypothetical protein
MRFATSEIAAERVVRSMDGRGAIVTRMASLLAARGNALEVFAIRVCVVARCEVDDGDGCAAERRLSALFIEGAGPSSAARLLFRCDGNRRSEEAHVNCTEYVGLNLSRYRRKDTGRS